MKSSVIKSLALLLLGSVIFISSDSLAYIPRGITLLEKTTENNGRGIYQIETEVQFPNGAESLSLKETWIIENENSMRLTVTGMRNWREQVLFSAVYSGGQKNAGGTTQRVTTDFIERYFHFRNTENFANALVQLQIVPQSIFQPKAVRANQKHVEYQVEPFLRYSRTGGVISYAFGPANTDKTLSGLWIEQDQFVLRKLRLPTGAEVVADKYSVFTRGLHFPRSRTVRWSNQNIQLQTLSVTGSNREQLRLAKSENNLNLLAGQPAESLVREFYQRFR